MLPAPTAEAMLVIGLLDALTEKRGRRCQKLSRRIVDVLGREPPKVRALRQTVPAIVEARDGAVSIMRMRCSVCPKRCKDPLTTS